VAKSVFHFNEIKKKDDRVLLQLNRDYNPPPEEEPQEEVPAYTGPTAEDLRREAEEFKVQWEQEKAEMLRKAEEEAAEIRKKAEETAAEESGKLLDDARAMKTDAETRSAEIIKNAQEEAEKITSKAKEEEEEIKKSAVDEGFTKGHEDGFQEGNREASRLIERVQTILERIMDKRQEILDETERQVIDLVLLITRKVVKVIAENQRDVVVANIQEALKKVKGRGDVIIHVNLADMELSTEHKEEFIKAIEGDRKITIAEDSGVDKGGCIVETDFGEVDARIASQLGELEQRILELSPMKNVPR
jgi:flagellar assembly protein FliH